MTRIAVLTANIGGIDDIKGLPKQDVDNFDFFYYNENNLPFPLPNLDNRLKSKYLKTQSHRFLPNYDAYIWLDGSVKVNSNNFVSSFMEKLEGFDVTIYKHTERKSVYEEMNYIDLQMSKGNQYLLTRYGNQQLMQETLFYSKSKMPEDYPLFNCYTFARWNNKKNNNCFDEWWKRCIEFSNFDQTMFSFVAWQYNLNINQLEIDPLRTHKIFTREPHIQ